MRDYEKMSKFDLPEEERRLIDTSAEMLIASFAKIDEIDTAEVAPLITVLEIQNVLRADESFKMLSREDLLANAPEQYDGYFQVPRTLD